MEVVEPMPIKEKKRLGRTPRYSDEYYMMMAKDIVENGMSFRTAADTYQCSHGTVSHWSKLYREGKLTERVEKRKSNVNKAEAQLQRQERYIKDLKAQVGELYLENQLLKKAQTYFQRAKNAPSSVITSESLDRYREDVEL